MHPLETYLRALHAIRATGAGVKETSYYTPLANLIDAVGAGLKPRVSCVLQLGNQGAGFPDGGLFTADQQQGAQVGQPLRGQMPARGVVEVKSPSADAWVTANSHQVTTYWKTYRQVLVTNYRDFVLIGQDDEGAPLKVESYRLAKDEADFWAAAANPAQIVRAVGDSFLDYLRRVMLQAAPLTAPRDVAWFLASYAREALIRIERANLPTLENVRTALEEALGLSFQGSRGEHFFRSTLVQTIFYGVFSAWVLWCNEQRPGLKAPFDWRLSVWELRVPIIATLFHQVTAPGTLGGLNLVEVLDWAAGVLNRVDRTVFFQRFQQQEAVQYFYEPFLESFDPQLRKELGVWYTPPEVVRYMVARVDTALREELGLADGLADSRVVVLDPCTGTGSYLVEVLRLIHERLLARDGPALAPSEVKQAATERIFGFEILPAPLVVAHLQIGLLLQELGAPLSELPNTETGVIERAAVYLTNALTGWEPPKGPKQRLPFLSLENERDAANEVKREQRILVVLGNPPYNGFAGVSPAEEEGLVEPYKAGLKRWGITKNYLDDLYVRFLRIAERRIAEVTGRGIVCYISNASYLSDPSFVGVRERFLTQFDEVWVDNLNGDSRETGKRTPEGRPDPSVFSTDSNREGIRVGTAVSLFVRRDERSPASPPARVLYRQFWGATKRNDLLDSLRVADFKGQYETIAPTPVSRYSFRARQVANQYDDWPSLADLAGASPLLGLNDNRRQALQDISRSALETRMRSYYDPSVGWDKVEALHSGLTTNAASFDALSTRIRLLRESRYRTEHVISFWYKPFDLRWAYAERVGNLWNRIRPELLDQAWDGNEFLLARRRVPKAPDGATFFHSHHVADQHSLHTDAYFVPFQLRKAASAAPAGQASFLLAAGETRHATTANLSAGTRHYLGNLGMADPDTIPSVAGLVWLHALAIGYSPLYQSENAAGLELDWARIPLPKTETMLRHSATLGRTITELLDIEHSVPGVTSGAVRPELQSIGVLSRHTEGALNLAVTAGWGFAGQAGVTMAGHGMTVERDYTVAEHTAPSIRAVALGVSTADLLTILGDRTFDIYLNEDTFWTNVPVRVWTYTIGGYQVLKKWLSYREQSLLRRSLTNDEARYFTDAARRIAALILLEAALDENYRSAKAAAYAWGHSSTAV